MIDVIEATFQDGVFRPDRQPALSDRSRVRLIVEPVVDDPDQSRTEQSWSTLEQLWRDSHFDSQGDRLSRDQLHERS